MNYNLYSYFDRVAGIYSAPVPAVNRAAAIRSFVANNRSNSTCADDMELYEIGSIDVNSGVITSIGAPVFVCRYTEYKEEV